MSEFLFNAFLLAVIAFLGFGLLSSLLYFYFHCFIAISYVGVFIATLLIYPISDVCAIISIIFTKSFKDYTEAKAYFEKLMFSKLEVSKQNEIKVTEDINKKIEERRKSRKEKRNIKTK